MQLNLRVNHNEKIEQIAISKKFVMKKGDIDYDRTCIMILDDFRKGKMGNITLLKNSNVDAGKTQQ